MLRQRLLSISLVIWLILLFNIERYDLLGINLPTMVYIVAAAVVVAVILVPDFVLIRWYILIVPVVLVYSAYRFLTIENETVIPSLVFIFVESAIIGLTYFLGWLISRQIADTERTYDALVMNSEHSRLLEPSVGEERFNQEFFRARQYDRPVTMLLIQPPGLKELGHVYKDHMSYQISLQHRYIKSRVAQLTESLLYATDPITSHGDNIVICLPETEEKSALELARRIAAVVHASLGISIQIGIVQLTKEMPLFEDMLKAAGANLYAFVIPSDDDDDSNDESRPPKPPTYTDDDTMPIPMLNEDGTIDYASSPPSATAGQAVEPEAEPVASNAKKKNISAYERLVSYLLGMQLFPLHQLRIHSDSIAKRYYNPDFWVNRLPYQSRASRIIYSYIKRLMDITIILLASPLLIVGFSLVALLIYIEDKGPVLYSQERTGRGNHTFKMWKFRSMIVDANDPAKLEELGIFRNERGETVDAEGNKLSNDRRITRIGRIIRKTSIDELPQLWNILMGDMSLVGPRPTSFGVDKYQISQTHRLTVKPGLTGLWQVYDRGDTDFENRLIWDMRYIDKMSLWLDLRVLVLTVTRQVLKQRGA